MSPGHLVRRQLTEAVYYPEHDPRSASKEYKVVHHHLVYVLNEPCWICGVRQSDLPSGQHMETHHWVVEWALANAIDPAKIFASFPVMGGADEPHLREWLDSEGNMLVLCEEHHRSAMTGIHMITYPAWVSQRYLRDDWDLQTGQTETPQSVLTAVLKKAVQ
jgi:hypothetical protein